MVKLKKDLNILLKRNYFNEKINYLIFGGLTTILSLLFINIYCTWSKKNIELQIANILSWIIGFLFAYFTNRKYVFERKNVKTKEEIFKFFLSRLSTLLLDMAIMFLFVTCLKLNDKISKIVSQVLVILVNYIL